MNDVGLHHVSLAFQYIYRCSDGGLDGDGKLGSEIPVGGGRVEMTWFCVVSGRRT